MTESPTAVTDRPMTRGALGDGELDGLGGLGAPGVASGVRGAADRGAGRYRGAVSFACRDPPSEAACAPPSAASDAEAKSLKLPARQSVIVTASTPPRMAAARRRRRLLVRASRGFLCLAITNIVLRSSHGLSTSGAHTTRRGAPESSNCDVSALRAGSGRYWSNDNRTVRSVLSAFRSTSAIDCQVPSASAPPTTGTVAYGGRNAGSTCERPWPREPCACRQRSSAGRNSASTASRSASLRAPSSMMARPAVACGTKTCSRPSPPSAAPAAKSAPRPVMSATHSGPAVRSRNVVVFMPGAAYPAASRQASRPVSRRLLGSADSSAGGTADDSADGATGEAVSRVAPSPPCRRHRQPFIAAAGTPAPSGTLGTLAGGHASIDKSIIRHVAKGGWQRTGRTPALGSGPALWSVARGSGHPVL